MNGRLRRSAGFALIEALVAMAVVGLGTLGLGGMQMFLARNADLAAQRTEAAAMAEACLESLRSYALPEDWADLPARPRALDGSSLCPQGPVDVTPARSSAVYQRQVVVGSPLSDNLKPVTVRVSWSDRSGEAQSMDFTTVIAKSDPADAARIVVPATGAPLYRNPNDRNIAIPALATDRLDGTSSLALGSSQIFFDNSSGLVSKVCNASGSCSALQAYYLDGYIKQIAIQPSAPGNCGLLGLNCLLSNLLGLLGNLLGSVQGLGMNYSGITVKNPGTAIQCTFSRDSTGLVSVVTNLVTSLLGGDKYFYYKCIIPFVNPSAQETATWGGKMRVGVNVNALSSTPVNYLVCRYQYTNVLAPAGLNADYVNDYIDNKSNVQSYKNVRYSLTDQNYMLFTGQENDIPDNCPKLKGSNGKPEYPIPESEVNPDFPPAATLVKHQRCTDGNVSTDCPKVSP
ncbi:MAG: prepilin-type N-terminal cleavage/methylation domain-containing protein [Burkholderiaceae bacterium]|nr:prepilin-type N-terminal cleavage/methylation domain-containing protein [Burkholderiaceae bacterium]